MGLPMIIQGGMGVAISDWRLAKAVSQTGQLGVVSGTGLSRVFICRLMDGDIAGHLRRALSHFPIPEAVQNILQRYFIAGGKAPEQAYQTPPAYTIHPSKWLDQLTVIANFVEVFLAKESHTGLVGINLLEKVQLPNLASLYGAMLAGVDFVLMGAGIPTQVAGILNKLALHRPAKYRLNVFGADHNDETCHIHFDPQQIFSGITEILGQLKRPHFLPIIASTALAQALVKRSEGQVDGFVIEGHTAGGHNAPPRGTLQLSEQGELIYSARDTVELEKIRRLGLPFWLAGGYGHPEQLQEALDAGAAGIQVGTAFALCNESGLEAQLKNRLLDKALHHKAMVSTSASASPTGFPFKVVQLEGTLSEPEIYAARPRLCDLGFLRTLFKRDDGTIGYRCPAEPVEAYVKKGGQLEETVGKVCLCNTLLATAGFPQRRKNSYVEPPLVTCGDDLVNLGQLLSSDNLTYSAKDVIQYLLGAILQRDAARVGTTTIKPSPEPTVVEEPVGG